MIVIWDNGGSYSEHKLCFVEIGDVSLEDALFIMNGEGRFGDIGEVVGAGASLLGERKPMSFREWIDWNIAAEYHLSDDEDDEECPVMGNPSAECKCVLRKRWARVKALGLLEKDGAA